MTDDLLFQAYLDGRATPGQGLFRAVGKDPVRYGALIGRISAHKKEKEEQESKSVMEKFEAELKARNYEFSKPRVPEEIPEPVPVPPSMWESVRVSCWCCRRKVKKSE